MYNNQLEHVFFYVLNDTVHTFTIEKLDISACIFSTLQNQTQSVWKKSKNPCFDLKKKRACNSFTNIDRMVSFFAVEWPINISK